MYAKSKPAMPAKLIEQLQAAAEGYEVGENDIFKGMSQFDVEHDGIHEEGILDKVKRIRRRN